jgi:hypothetical protein
MNKELKEYFQYIRALEDCSEDNPESYDFKCPKDVIENSAFVFLNSKQIFKMSVRLIKDKILYSIRFRKK